MESKKDLIVDIPKERIRFFGGGGKMLLPSPATVGALMEKIPKHKLATTSLLCQTLTEQFKVRGTCPVTTQQAIQAVANDPTKIVAYWPVIKTNGGLFSRFPGGVDGHATHLKEEGFALDTKGQAPKVKGFKESLVRFH